MGTVNKSLSLNDNLLGRKRGMGMGVGDNCAHKSLHVSHYEGRPMGWYGGEVIKSLSTCQPL